MPDSVDIMFFEVSHSQGMDYVKQRLFCLPAEFVFTLGWIEQDSLSSICQIAFKALQQILHGAE